MLPSNPAQLSDRLLTSQVGVLGSMLIDPDAAGLVLSSLSADDFIAAEYRVIFEAARKVYSDGQPVDALTVNSCLGGGHDRTLIELMDLTPTSTNVQAYIDILRDEAKMYRLRDIGVSVSLSRDLDEIREHVDAINAELCSRPGVTILPVGTGAVEFCERHANSTPERHLPWCFGLDDELSVMSGAYVVVGARPSAGKTALAMQNAFLQAREYNVGFFSLETSSARLMDRLMSQVSKVSLQSIVHNRLSTDDCESVARDMSVMSGRRLDLIPSSSMTVADIRAITMARHYDVIYIDYLQLVAGSSNARYRDRYSVVTDLSMDLHRLAQDTGCIVIALSQLSRPERNKGGREREPVLADLRESGQLEQDADIVLLLSEETPGARDGLRLLHIAKNKDGNRGGRLYLDFDGDHQTFCRSIKCWVPPENKSARPAVNSLQLSLQDISGTAADDKDLPF